MNNPLRRYNITYKACDDILDEMSAEAWREWREHQQRAEDATEQERLATALRQQRDRAREADRLARARQERLRQHMRISEGMPRSAPAPFDTGREDLPDEDF